MRKTAVALLCLLLAVPAAAGAQSISGGIKGGVEFSSIPNFTKLLDGGGIDVGTRRGWMGGVFVNVSALPGISIQPEIMLTQKGTTAKTLIGDVDVRLDYVDIPVLARISTGVGGVRAYVMGGPSFNINLKAEATLAGETEDLKEDVEPAEISLVGAIGLEVSQLVIEARWIEGVKGVSKVDADHKHRTFAILAGVRF